MRAVFCEELGDPRALVVRDVDPPGDPAENQIKVALEARGLSFVDVLTIAGQYHVKQELPFVPGSEAAGVVTQVGSGVEALAPGDRVMVPGGCVEEVLLRAAQAVKLPDSVSFEAAAAFRSNYTTALYAMQRARLEPGEVLLVHGAAGGVGLAAVDVGKHLGATVIGTAGSDEKLAVVSQVGADHTINYNSKNNSKNNSKSNDGGFRERVKELTGGRGADVIYDPVGGDVFDESMRCIAPFGRILIVGFAGGRPGLAKTNHLLVKDASVIGFTIGALGRHDPAWAARNFEVLMGWLAAGRLTPYVSHRVPLEKTADALQLIIDRKVIGKVIVV